MPVVFRYRGYRFFFFSNEGNPLEPCHIHVRKGDALAKIWICPEVRLAHNYSFSSSELRHILQVVSEHTALIEEKWNEYFSI
ncbi:DUF4160 domain-containing protein [Candidatus Albibeggiatoa sp. nov. BB20]|uniref:DUF4160 domain-containing protein n=1 Tax=Candidatus Albibeggiatoa sp. nov. BB20 TaxID=3162723 RepID=UPI0033659339